MCFYCVGENLWHLSWSVIRRLIHWFCESITRIEGTKEISFWTKLCLYFLIFNSVSCSDFKSVIKVSLWEAVKASVCCCIARLHLVWKSWLHLSFSFLSLWFENVAGCKLLRFFLCSSEQVLEDSAWGTGRGTSQCFVKSCFKQES